MPPPRRPKPKISLWRRFRIWLRYARSPLELRASLQRLRQNHKHPLIKLLRMFIPFPSWYFKIPGPYSCRALIEDERRGTGIIESIFGDLHNLRAIPIWRVRDTPLRSIYRLYALFLAGQYDLMGYETEYFFKHPDWKLRNIPDPQDPDPLRYAVVACIVEELHRAVNWRLSLGLRRNGERIYRDREDDPWPPYHPEDLPGWTKSVLPIDKFALLEQSVPAEMLDGHGNLVLQENGTSPIFAQRNIMTNTGWLYTI